MRYIFVLMLLAACDAKPLPRPDWENAPKEYTCSIKQLKVVDIQFKICQQSNFISEYCYGTAIMNSCTKRKV